MTQDTNQPQPIRVNYSNVDQSTHPHQLVRYLEEKMGNPQLQAIKRQSYTLLEASEGKQLLDVGCGIGDDVRALAQIVGPRGRVVGVEKSEYMLDACFERSEGIALPWAFFLGDIHHLDYSDPESQDNKIGFAKVYPPFLFSKVDFLRSAIVE